MQKLTGHDPQSAREQVRLLSNSGCVASLFPVAESDPPADIALLVWFAGCHLGVRILLQYDGRPL